MDEPTQQNRWVETVTQKASVPRRKRGPKPRWHKAFLDAFRQIGVIAPACAAAGIGREAVRKANVRDPEFAAKFEQAFEDSTERLEAVAFARASRAESPSDNLLMFLLKSRRPQKYRDNYRLEHTGPDGAEIPAPVQHSTVIILPPKEMIQEETPASHL